MNESVAPVPAPDPASEPAWPQRIRLPFEFRGSGSEYFRIWIVNLALTIFTLGIFSAWAKVRRMRYFYGNTCLDGHAFEYHGRPLAILKGRLVVLAGYIVFFALTQVYVKFALVLVPIIIFGLPWIVYRSRLFHMRMTSYRNVHFDFRGTYGGAMYTFIAWYLFSIVTLMTLYPAWVRKRVDYTLSNSDYGHQHFVFSTATGRYYGFCILTFVMGMVAYFAFIKIFTDTPGALGTLSENAGSGPVDLLAALGVRVWLLILAGVFVGYCIWGFYKARFINESFGGIQVGENYVRSELKIGALIGIYLTNLLGILFTLGLYYPWAKVRQHRYQVENTALDSDGDLSHFIATGNQTATAYGEEAGDFFDVDFGL